jgi:iron complex transport system permease protein
MEFWLLGSVGSATWVAVGSLAVIGGAAIVYLLGSARTLDLLALGEVEARHLGVDVDLSGAIISIAVGVMTGAAVGAGGVIGFVGLLVPTIVRPVVGHLHRQLIVASALAGAVVLIGVDTVARTVLVPIEIPVGLLTTAIGGPVFLWLLGRLRSVRL